MVVVNTGENCKVSMSGQDSYRYVSGEALLISMILHLLSEKKAEGGVY